MVQAPDAYAAAEQKLAVAHRAMLHTAGLQLDFKAAPPEPPPPNWLIDLGKFLAQFGPELRFVFWGGLALAVALILWFIVREILATRFLRRDKSPPPADWRPEASAARELLEAADALAGQGRFGEAIHLILFRSIEELTGRRPGVVRPALTSRDISALGQIPPGPRSAFARIAARVEPTFFGGREASATDFAAARADYETFAFAEDWA